MSELRTFFFLLTDLFQLQLYRGELGRPWPEDSQRRVPGLPDILEGEDLHPRHGRPDQHSPAERPQADQVRHLRACYRPALNTAGCKVQLTKTDIMFFIYFQIVCQQQGKFSLTDYFPGCEGGEYTEWNDVFKF